MNATPTTDDLKQLFYSDLYQQMLADYDQAATHKLDKRVQNATGLFNMLIRKERDFKWLGIPTDQVLAYFETEKCKLLAFAISCTNFFIAQPTTDGDFPEGEEQGEENKPVTLQVWGVAKTFLLDVFCELFILETKNKERLLHYLQATRMPGAKKYAEQITHLYNQLA